MTAVRIEDKDIIELIEATVRMTVHETVAELRKGGFLLVPDKPAYENTAARLRSYFAKINDDVALGADDLDIEYAITAVQSDPMYLILPLYYSDGCTIDEIALMLECAPCTVTRNKKRLCLKIHDFLTKN